MRQLFFLFLLLPAYLSCQPRSSDDAPPLFEPPTYDSVEMANEIIHPVESLTKNEGRDVTTGILIDSTGDYVPFNFSMERNAFEAAVESALKSHQGFQPGRLDGTPINTAMVVTFRFAVNAEGKGEVAITLDSSIYGKQIDNMVFRLRNPDSLNPDAHPKAKISGYDSAELASHLVYPDKYPRGDVPLTTYVSVKINKEGRVVEATVVKRVDPDLDAAALAAVKKTRFTPTVQNGIAIPMKMIIPVTFMVSVE